MAGPANYADRIQVFTNMLKADPENELAHFTLGKLYLESGDLESAEKSLRQTLGLNPRHSVAMKLLGQVLMERGRKEEAIEMLKNGVLLAHEKGEYQPRNQMQELLKSLGVTPPDPVEHARQARGAGAAPGQWFCSRCGKPNPRREAPPFDSPLGKRIFETICAPCWKEWIAMSIKVINEYRLNLATEQGSKIYDHHLREFFGITD
ncbi:MAG: Fe(2+)-trafficking protein [Planctomycetes bacterium]|nr:Fe(2+)-trafficking protein [Planctomycetota bacterium]